MIRQNQHILYVMEGNSIVYFKSAQQKQVGNAGFCNKKIVVTSHRLLIFQSLANRIQETEYELTAGMAKKSLKNSQLPEKKSRISICGLPEIELDIMSLDSKVIIDEEPSIYKYLQKQNIQNIAKSLVGMVLLRLPKKGKFYLVHAGGVNGAIKLSKAIICGQSWSKYQGFCKEMRLEVNPMWVRILTQVIQNDDSVVLIDPDLFVTGNEEELKSFIFLVAVIPFVHCFHHRYSINTLESARYASQFVTPIQAKTHSLSFKQTHMNSQIFKNVISKATLPNLLKLDLCGNIFDDEVFDALNRLVKAGAKRLCYLNLSHNLINFSNPQLLVGLLKSCSTILHLDLSYNQIEDSSTETIQKYIIYALNPPLEEINLSFNKFSRKIAWRLFVGNLRNFDSHPYLKFILYPVPIKKEIFGQYQIDFPRHNTTINLNMHSALIEQFEVENIMKHTFEDIPATALNTLTINFTRVLAPNVKLPNNRQDLNKTLQISHKIENFIYAPQSVQKIYSMALELKNFPFEVPPTSRAHFIKYLFEKFNEALFIRDHYSVKYLLKALQDLGAQVEGYTDRLSKLKQRNLIYRRRAESIMNFDMDQGRINQELDQLVRQGLRLYLQGPGVQLIYYLKFKRDQYVQKYLQQKLNPQHYLFDLMAKKNISAQQHISQKQFIVPYQIRLQKKINEHFYLHPWQANYQILSQMKMQTFDTCLQFLQQSDKKQKFAMYFDRIEQRIQFIKNQFTYFSFNKFKASYSDLKINACRLLFLYNNIKDTNLYLQIPNYVKKRNVTQEKTVVVLNREWFRREYHIINYININLKARKANFYNYDGVISRYENQIFQNQVKKILIPINKLLKKIQIVVSSRQPFVLAIPSIIEHFKLLIDIIRHSLVPEELKEQMYLHFISWRKGRFGNNTQIIQLLPTFTMYLKPPLQIQKFLIAAILQNQSIHLSDIPLCLATNPNQPTSENIILLQNAFVERDWLPLDKVYCQLFEKKGQASFDVQLLDKSRIMVTVGESKTVAQLMLVLVESIEVTAEDKQHFWLYKMNKQTQEMIPYESREHIGEILSDYDPKDSLILLKRRIYSRELKFNYSKYGQSMVNSLYHDFKYEYMCRHFFVNDKLACEIASIFFMIENVQNFLIEAQNKKYVSLKVHLQQESLSQILIQKQKQLQSTFMNYIPLKIYKRLLKPKEVVVAELRAKISQRILKSEYNNIYEMKLNLLNIFAKFPQFASTNYQVSSKEKAAMRLSVNAMYIFIESSQETETIHLEKIVSIIPKQKYLLLYYHKQQNLVTQLPIFGQEKLMFALAMDILSYCSIRIKMSSINLYQIYSVQNTQTKMSTLQQSLRKIYDKNKEGDLIKCKQNYQAGIKRIVKMSLTLMLFKELQYYTMNKYIKSYVNRKLYANKSERKLDYDKDFDQDERQEISQANKKILQMIFPKLEMKVEEEEEEEHFRQRRLQDPEESMDFRREYDKLNLQTTNKKQNKQKAQYLEPRSAQHLGPQSQYQAPQSRTSQHLQPGPKKQQGLSSPSAYEPRPQYQPQTPIQYNKNKQDEDKGQMVTGKGRKRVPNRRNR